MGASRLGTLLCVLVVNLLGGCEAETPDPPPEPAPTCATALARWDARHATARDLEASPAVLDARFVHAGEPALVDGDPGTAVAVVAPATLELRLDGALPVRGLRYTPAPGLAPIGRARVYLSFDRECWGEPAADLTFTGAPAEDHLFDGRVARFVRIEILDAAPAGAEVGIADLGLFSDGAVTTTPATYATVGVRWRYAPRASLPAAEAVAWELLRGPAGLRMDDGGVLELLPTEADVGEHEIRIAAVAGHARVEQRFVLRVAGSRAVASGVIPPEGGSLVVGGSGSDLDGIEVIVPPHALAAGAAVSVHAAGDPAPPEPAELAPVGERFFVTTDLPPGTSLQVRVPTGGFPSPELGAETFVTSYGEEAMHLGDAVDASAPVDTRSDAGGTIFGLRVPGGDRAHVFRRGRGASLQLDHDVFEITYLRERDRRGEPASGEVEAWLRRMADALVVSRDALAGAGCRAPMRQRVFVRSLPVAGLGGLVWPEDGRMELNADILRERPELIELIVPHETVHVAQWLVIGPPLVAPEEAWWRESMAHFGADEIFDRDLYVEFHAWVEDRYGPTTPRADPYALVSFFKALRAQRGFALSDVCRFADQRSRYAPTGGSMSARALEAVLGGPSAALEAFAGYIAAWDYLRTEAVLDDAPAFFSPSDEHFVTPFDNLTVLEDGHVGHEWREAVRFVPGGHSARFRLDPEPQAVDVEVRAPTDEFVGLVYSEAHELLGTLSTASPRLHLEGAAGYLYVTVAMRLPPPLSEPYVRPTEVDVRVSTDARVAVCDPEDPVPEDPDCPPGVCAGAYAACTETADCCGAPMGLWASCVFWTCAHCTSDQPLPGMPCDEAVRGQCCGLATCAPKSSPADTRCCAEAGIACASDDDCCGFVRCVSGVCSCQGAGEPCFRGDECCAGSICTDGTCT